MSVEQRILDLPAFADYNDRRQLRAIAMDVRNLEDRVKQLEQENDPTTYPQQRGEKQDGQGIFRHEA